jgi:hypothetical protein
MYTLLLILFLILSGGLLFLFKSNPGLKPAVYTLPVLALLLFVFRPAPSGRIREISPRFQQQLAQRTGEHLAQALRPYLAVQGPILVLHPDKSSPEFQQRNGNHILAAIEESFKRENRRVIFFASEDELHADLTSLHRALSQNSDTAGIILAGLQLSSDENLRNASLPPIVLSDLGDPGTSEWALEHGLAVAALFHRDGPHPAENRITPDDYFKSRFEFRTAAGSQ